MVKKRSNYVSDMMQDFPSPNLTASELRRMALLEEQKRSATSSQRFSLLTGFSGKSSNRSNRSLDNKSRCSNKSSSRESFLSAKSRSNRSLYSQSSRGSHNITPVLEEGESDIEEETKLIRNINGDRSRRDSNGSKWGKPDKEEVTSVASYLEAYESGRVDIKPMHLDDGSLDSQSIANLQTIYTNQTLEAENEIQSLKDSCTQSKFHLTPKQTKSAILGTLSAILTVIIITIALSLSGLLAIRKRDKFELFNATTNSPSIQTSFITQFPSFSPKIHLESPPTNKPVDKNIIKGSRSPSLTPTTTPSIKIQRRRSHLPKLPRTYLNNTSPPTSSSPPSNDTTMLSLMPSSGDSDGFKAINMTLNSSQGLIPGLFYSLKPTSPSVTPITGVNNESNLSASNISNANKNSTSTLIQSNTLAPNISKIYKNNSEVTFHWNSSVFNSVFNNSGKNFASADMNFSDTSFFHDSTASDIMDKPSFKTPIPEPSFVWDLDTSFSSPIKSVDISHDGSRIVMSMPWANSSTGNVYIYQYETDIWKEIARFSGQSKNEYFGFSTSLSADGLVLAIGTSNNDPYVKIYHELYQDTWTQMGENLVPVGPRNNFGFSISLTSEGDKIAVGDPGSSRNGLSSSGSVVFFSYNAENSDWEPFSKGLDGESADDYFGYSISFKRDFVVVGAPFASYVRVYRMQWDKMDWALFGSQIDGHEPGDLFGSMVSMSTNGSRFCVGAPGKNSGVVSVFESINNGFFNRIGGYIYGHGPNDANGHELSLSGDGKRIAIGGTRPDVYELEFGVWKGVELDSKEFNSPFLVDLSYDGQKIAVVAEHNVLLYS